MSANIMEARDIDSSTAVHPVFLNYDVLCVMLQNIGDRRTLSRLMRTCHELYTQGVPLLLDVDVVRLNLDNSESLHSYLKRDLARYNYLRRLQITMLFAGSTQEQAMNALTTIVLRASKLAELSIDRNALQLSPTLLNTVARLKTIEVLSINGVSTTVHNMLRFMQSPVREMKISVVSVAGYANLVPSLSRFSSTLEKIEINYSQWPSRAHPDVIFPGVSSLRLDVYEPETSVVDLMHMMPNLQRLYTYQEAALAHPDRIRKANLAAQDTIGPRPWRSLDYANASLNSLYSLAPRCHIRHLALSSIQSGKTDTSRVRDVLAAAHPTCVSLDLMCMKQDNCDFASLFSHTPSSVTRLNLKVQLPATSPVKDHVKALLGSFGAIPSVTRLQLTVVWRMPRESTLFPSKADITQREGLNADAAYLSQLEDMEMVQKLAETVASLRIVNMDLYFPRPGGKNWRETFWRIEDDRQSARLSTAEGRAAMRVDDTIY